MIEFDKSALTRMAEREKHLMHVAAEEGAQILSDNLSNESGTGVKYPSLPNRSSAPGEYPVLQTGQLQSGVAVEEGAGTSSEIAIHDDLGKLLGLEFSVPSANPNFPPAPPKVRVSGGRAPMWRTFTDGQTTLRMNEAMRRS